MDFLDQKKNYQQNFVVKYSHEKKFFENEIIFLKNIFLYSNSLAFLKLVTELFYLDPLT